MNTTLQRKLDDLKVKYTALQSARTNGTTIKGSASTKHTSTTDNDVKNGVSTKVGDYLLPKIMSTVASRHHNPMQFLLPPRAKKNRILQSRKMPIPA